LSILSLTLAFSGVGVGSSQVEAPVADTAPVTFVASDYAFSGPDRLPAGLTTVRLINRGQDLHQLQFIKLPDNKTAADFMAELADNPSRLPSWAQRRGGPNSVIPGEQAVAMINLEPGLYIVLCGIPDAQNRPHVLLGMQTSLRVDAPVTSASPPPHSDLTMTLVDFGFELSKPLKAGKQMIHVVNRGSQPHEVVIVRLARGASVADFLDRFLPGVPILPAGKPIGGITGLEPGRDAFFRGDFAPGRYGLICFLPDVTTRGPHFARGMMMDVTVE
jgi:hypothetical protein